MSAWHDRSLRAMGCDVHLRVLTEPAAGSDALDTAERLVRELDAEWSRFSPLSALSRLNADPRAEVRVPPRLARAIGVALDAASASGWLVDPTMGARMRALGYDRTFSELWRDDVGPLRGEPVPAWPGRDARARAVRVDIDRGIVSRAPGVELDLGGIGKGLAADLVIRALRHLEHVVADIGGDLVCGGTRVTEIAQPVLVAGPARDVLHTFELRGGAVATSGITRRAWRTGARRAHHLLDPSTGLPAHTGLVQVTALAPTGAEAERRAKHALLAGPVQASAILCHGGLTVGDDGCVHVIAAGAVAA